MPVVLCKGDITPIFSQSQRLVTTYKSSNVPGFVNLLAHAHKVFETGLIEAVKDEARLTL